MWWRKKKMAKLEELIKADKDDVGKPVDVADWTNLTIQIIPDGVDSFDAAVDIEGTLLLADERGVEPPKEAWTRIIPTKVAPEFFGLPDGVTVNQIRAVVSRFNKGPLRVLVGGR